MIIVRDAESTAVIAQRYGLGSIMGAVCTLRCADSHIVEVDGEMPDVAALGGMQSKSSGSTLPTRASGRC
jgi:hypothetical protein